MTSLAALVDEVATATGFSGAVRVDRSGATELSVAYGFADRGHAIPNTPGTRFAIASGTKTFTALVVMALVEQGLLDLGTTARSLLAGDLPLVADDVTVEHLLAHRSGIGDYLDEEALADITDHVLTVPVHRLDSTEAYLAVLGGRPTVFRAGSRFAYNNAGYVLLALLAERAAGADFPHLVRSLVTEPAGMADTGFLRTDELPGEAAIGYLAAAGLRTNVLHLPVLGSGDGGVYTTVADLAAFWEAVTSGRVVAPVRVAEMLRPRSEWPEERRRYGLGFHLHESTDAVFLEGYDAGVSFASVHRPSAESTYTVLANWSDGAWPVIRRLSDHLDR